MWAVRALWARPALKQLAPTAGNWGPQYVQELRTPPREHYAAYVAAFAAGSRAWCAAVLQGAASTLIERARAESSGGRRCRCIGAQNSPMPSS